MRIEDRILLVLISFITFAFGLTIGAATALSFSRFVGALLG